MAKRATLVLALVLIAAAASASNITVTFTTAQDTQIQTKLIPILNTAKCASQGLPSSCTSAQLVTAGCIAVAFPSKNYNHCNIYTLDLAGETTLAQDELNQQLVDRLASLNAQNAEAALAACRAATLTVQNQVCTTLGLASGCNPCP